MTPPPLNNLAISPRQKKKLVLALLAAATGTHVAAVGSWGVGRLGWIRRPLIRERVVSTNQKDMDPWVSVGLAKQSAPQKRERERGGEEQTRREEREKTTKQIPRSRRFPIPSSQPTPFHLHLHLHLEAPPPTTTSPVSTGVPPLQLLVNHPTPSRGSSPSPLVVVADRAPGPNPPSTATASPFSFPSGAVPDEPTFS